MILGIFGGEDVIHWEMEIFDTVIKFKMKEKGRNQIAMENL